MKSPRKNSTKKFREEDVKMVLNGGMSKAEVGRRPDVHQTQIGIWDLAY